MNEYPMIGSEDILMAYITRFNLSPKKEWLQSSAYEKSNLSWRRRILDAVRGPSEWQGRWQGLDEAWIEARLTLMRRFLIESLRSQQDQDFVWLVLLHPDTPSHVRRNIQVIPQCRLIETETEVTNQQGFAAECVDYLCDSFTRKILITARIDSDDGVNKKHAQMLKEVACGKPIGEDGFFTDFPDGSFYNIQTRRGYRKKSSSRSCGICRIEPFNADAKTIYCGDHTQIAERPDCVSIRTNEPMWIQTTHGFHINRPNKVLPIVRLLHGTDTQTRNLRKSFPGITF